MSLKIVLASNNQGKLREIRQITEPLSLTFIPQSDFNIEDADETGLSFIENSIIKARHAAETSGLPAIADDSGLAVDALNGEPGIYSARYAGTGADDQKNLDKLLEQMAGIEDSLRTARFHCAMTFVRHAKDPIPLICQGTWEGRILHAPTGKNGFGYDPVFYLAEQNCSAAQLQPAIKNRLSHRGQALTCLLNELGNL